MYEKKTAAPTKKNMEDGEEEEDEWMASKCYPTIGFTFAHSVSMSNVIRCKETSASDREMSTTTEKKEQKKIRSKIAHAADIAHFMNDG